VPLLNLRVHAVGRVDTAAIGAPLVLAVCRDPAGGLVAAAPFGGQAGRYAGRRSRAGNWVVCSHETMSSRDCIRAWTRGACSSGSPLIYPQTPPGAALPSTSRGASLGAGVTRAGLVIAPARRARNNGYTVYCPRVRARSRAEPYVCMARNLSRASTGDTDCYLRGSSAASPLPAAPMSQHKSWKFEAQSDERQPESPNSPSHFGCL
jgi:hypothetical protein